MAFKSYNEECFNHCKSPESKSCKKCMAKSKNPICPKATSSCFRCVFEISVAVFKCRDFFPNELTQFITCVKDSVGSTCQSCICDFVCDKFPAACDVCKNLVG